MSTPMDRELRRVRLRGSPAASEAAEALLVDRLRVEGDSVVINGSVRDTARHENGVSGWHHSRRIYSTD